jgi:hypothetical protein
MVRRLSWWIAALSWLLTVGQAVADSLPPIPDMLNLKTYGSGNPYKFQVPGTVLSKTPLKRGQITLTGRIDYGQDERFLYEIGEMRGGLIILDGPGGSLDAAMSIGAATRFHGFATYVPPGKSCASACAYIWLAGVRRYIGKGARVGFHAISEKVEQERVVSATGNALLGSYLANLGYDMSIVEYATAAAPSSMMWLNENEARQIGLTAEFNISEIPEPWHLTAPDSTPEPNSSVPLSPLLAVRPSQQAGTSKIQSTGKKHISQPNDLLPMPSGSSVDIVNREIEEVLGGTIDEIENFDSPARGTPCLACK